MLNQTLTILTFDSAKIMIYLNHDHLFTFLFENFQMEVCPILDRGRKQSGSPKLLDDLWYQRGEI